MGSLARPKTLLQRSVYKAIDCNPYQPECSAYKMNLSAGRTYKLRLDSTLSVFERT
jgi:hypothetical protein